MASIDEYYEFLHTLEDDRKYMIENNHNMNAEQQGIYDQLLAFYNSKIEYWNKAIEEMLNEQD